MSGAMSAITMAVTGSAAAGMAAEGVAGTLGTIMSVATPIVGAVGTIAQARGQQEAGESAKYEANYAATQEHNQANTVAAEGEQKAQQQDLQTQYMLSSAAAKAAGSGGSVDDPSTQNVMQTIAGQGRLRSLMDIYQGQQSAQNLNNEATATAYGGELKAQAGQTAATSTIIGGASSMFSKYWPAVSTNSNPSTPGGGGSTPLPWELPLQYQNSAAQDFYGQP